MSMRCELHSWNTEGAEWCWRCEELKQKENKIKYENIVRDSCVQRINGDKEINIQPNTTHKN